MTALAALALALAAAAPQRVGGAQLIGGAQIAGGACDARSLFAGRWTILPSLADEPEAQVYCPNTARQSTRYDCARQPPRAAFFQLDSDSACPAWADEAAVGAGWLRLHEQLGGSHILLVGDSLTYQLYHGLSCELERFGVPLDVRVSHSFFLRDGLPCDPVRCADADARRRERAARRDGPCSACADAEAPPRIRELDNARWRRQLAAAAPRGTGPAVLLLGAGAWYNEHKGLPEPTVEYERTLAGLVSFLEGLPAPPSVLWLTLPPARDALYGHQRFAAFDALAAAAFGASKTLRASLLNMTEAQAGRDDPALSPDGVHWCSSSATSMPKFVARRLLRLLLDMTRTSAAR